MLVHDKKNKTQNLTEQENSGHRSTWKGWVGTEQNRLQQGRCTCRNKKENEIQKKHMENRELVGTG